MGANLEIQSKFSKNTSLTKTDAMLVGIATILRILFVPLFANTVAIDGCKYKYCLNGNLLACSRLAGSKLDVPGYQLVPS